MMGSLSVQYCRFVHISDFVCVFGGAIDIHNTDSRSDQPSRFSYLYGDALWN